MEELDGAQAAERMYIHYEELVMAETQLDREIRRDIMKAGYKNWDELTPQSNGKFVAENKATWRRSGDYRRTIRKWNAFAPKASEVPSGTNDTVKWRHEELLDRLYERQVKKSGENYERINRPRNWTPGQEWPAYVKLNLMDHIKFNDVSTKGTPGDPDAPSVRQLSIGRAQQRKGTREFHEKKKKAKKRNAESSVDLNAMEDRNLKKKQLKVLTLKTIHDVKPSLPFASERHPAGQQSQPICTQSIDPIHPGRPKRA